MDLLHTGACWRGTSHDGRWVELACGHARADVRAVPAQGGTIAPGADADIVIYDPNAKQVFSAATHHMNVDYSCYEGKEITGRGREGALPGAAHHTTASRGYLGAECARPVPEAVSTVADTSVHRVDMDFGVVLQTDPPAGAGRRPRGPAPRRHGFSHVWTFDSHLLWQEPYVVYSADPVERRIAMSSGRW